MIQGWLLAGLYDVRICYILRRGTRDRDGAVRQLLQNVRIKYSTHLLNIHTCTIYIKPLAVSYILFRDC